MSNKPVAGARLVTRASRASLTTLGGLVGGLISAALVAGVPAWHSGLPYFVTYLIPILVSALGAFATAVSVKHPVAIEEVESYLTQIGELVEKVDPHVGENVVDTPKAAEPPAESLAHFDFGGGSPEDLAAKIKEPLRLHDLHPMALGPDYEVEVTPGMGSSAAGERPGDVPLAEPETPPAPQTPEPVTPVAAEPSSTP